MKVDVWYDFSCPFCYIGIHNFILALETFQEEYKTESSVYFRSFQLSKDAPLVTTESVYTSLAQKYGVDESKAKAMTVNAVRIAKEAGLTLTFDKVIPISTLRAHLLTQYIGIKSPQLVIPMILRLFKGYFEFGENLADEATLVAICQTFEIDAEVVKEIIVNREHEESVLHDENEASQLGISSVPFFVFNEKDAVAGAQTPVNFYQVMKEINLS